MRSRILGNISLLNLFLVFPHIFRCHLKESQFFFNLLKQCVHVIQPKHSDEWSNVLYNMNMMYATHIAHLFSYLIILRVAPFNFLYI